MSYVSYIGSPQYERTGPITNRSAHTLAVYHGFPGVEALANDIPEGSEVIDLGAGFSTLGHAVAGQRSDIRWINFDAAYPEAPYDPFITRGLTRLTAEAPSNLVYLGGDILQPPQELMQRRFARVFSYYMLPHIIDNGRWQGITAVQNMLNMGLVGGRLSIGPESDFSGHAQTFTVPVNAELSSRVAAEIVDSWIAR